MPGVWSLEFGVWSLEFGEINGHAHAQSSFQSSYLLPVYSSVYSSLSNSFPPVPPLFGRFERPGA